jgi:hypothetical protein
MRINARRYAPAYRGVAGSGAYGSYTKIEMVRQRPGGDAPSVIRRKSS